MRRHMKPAAIILLSLAVITGCGQSSRSAAAADESSIPEDTLSVSEDKVFLGNENIATDESMTESQMIAEAGNTENTKGNIKEELPDYLKGDKAESGTDTGKEETVTETESHGTAEGINAAVGSEITAASNAESCTLGETYTIHTHIGDIDLNVKDVEVVRNTDPNSSAKSIVRVLYDYSNPAAESGILIGSIFFRMADDEGRALAVYTPDYSLEENPEPQVVEAGQSCEALIAFELYKDIDEMTLFFDDQTTGVTETQQLFWVIR